MSNLHPLPKPVGAVDIVPRGRIRLIYRLFAEEFHEDIWKALKKALHHKDSRINLLLIQEIADRLEGRPMQTHQFVEKRTTVFRQSDGTEVLRSDAGTPPGDPPQGSPP